MVGRTRADAAATRERILDAAEDIFTEVGVAKASLESIARHAGVTRGAVYWHFRDKADLLDAMLDRVRLPLDELLQSCDGPPLPRIRDLCVHALEKLATDEHFRRVHVIMFHRCETGLSTCAERHNRMVSESVVLIEDLLRQAHARGELRPGVDPRLTAVALHAFMVGLFYSWLRDPALYDLGRDAADLVDTFLGSVVEG